MNLNTESAINQEFLRFVRDTDLPKEKWETCYWLFARGFASGALWQLEQMSPRLSELHTKCDDLAERAKELMA